MPRRGPEIPDIDDRIRRYKAGESTKALSEEIGVNPQVLRHRFKERGINLSKGRKIPIPDFETAKARYLAGEPVTKLAEEIGVAQFTLSRRLREAGVKTRTVSDTIHLAHEAITGRVVPFEEQTRKAKSKERGQVHASPSQLRLAKYLSDYFSKVEVEKALGVYNIDIGIDDAVVVEVLGGRWHTSRPHRLRSEYIFDQGWNLVFAWDDSRRHPLGIRAAKDIIAFTERTKRDPTFRRQYRMIWGTGEVISTGCADCDDWTLIGPGKRRMK